MGALDRRSVVIVVLGVMLGGCASLGIRPAEPQLAQQINSRQVTACDEFIAYFDYAQKLQESYHSRASQNRFWIYGAGILGLGVVAASGGLAAAGAATVGTLALLSISGGFSAGLFATIDNPTLADIYTIAATKIDAALNDAHAQIPPTLYATANDAACKTALNDLWAKVSDARSRLEEARTDSAKAALQRAVAQQEALKKLAAQIQQVDDPTIFVQRAVITAISPTILVTAKTQVTLTVVGGQLDSVLERDMKVSVGGQQVNVTSRALAAPADPSVQRWTVTFEAPALAAAGQAYDVTLLVGANRRPVTSAPGSKIQLRY